MLASYLSGRVEVVVGDITQQDVDAIVNAANSSLMGGGGVDGAIHSAGGDAILEACIALRQSHWPKGLPTGEAVITTGGDLKARSVIHTVGPVYGKNGGRDAELLASCYRRSLEVAAAQGLTSIAFAAISTGVYGYPKAEAAQVASVAIRDALAELVRIQLVRLVFFSAADAQVFVEHQRLE